MRKTIKEIFEEQYQSETNLIMAIQDQNYYSEDEAKEDLFALAKNIMRDALLQKRQDQQQKYYCFTGKTPQIELIDELLEELKP